MGLLPVHSQSQGIPFSGSLIQDFPLISDCQGPLLPVLRLERVGFCQSFGCPPSPKLSHNSLCGEMSQVEKEKNNIPLLDPMGLFS